MRFKKQSKKPQITSKRVRVKKNNNVLALKMVEGLVSALCLSSQHGSHFLIMTIALVERVAVHLLPANTRITKCVAFPDRRGTVLQSSTVPGIYYSCSGSYVPCSYLLWFKRSSMVGQKDSKNHLAFPDSALISDFPKRSKTLADFFAPLQT